MIACPDAPGILRALLASLLEYRQSSKGIRKMAPTKLDQDNGVHVETAEDDLKNAEGVHYPVIEGRIEKEKELLRKIDLRMMPLMMLICKAASLVLPESTVVVSLIADILSRCFELSGQKQHRNCPPW